MNILLLGLGNSIMTDDGIGPQMIDYLQNSGKLPEGVRLMDGGTLGLDLLPYLEDVKNLLIVDAVELGAEPGTLVRLTGEDVPAAIENKLSPHQMGLKDLLAVARLMGCLPENVTLFGMQPASLELGTELSPPVQAAFPKLAGLLLDELSDIVQAG